MNPDEYQRLAARTECNQSDSCRRMMGGGDVPPGLLHPIHNDHPDLVPIRLNHSLVGCSKQVGELMRQLQKWIYYGGKLDIVNVVEEYGDLLWFIAEGLNALGLSMSTVMSANIAKLRARYPDRFTGEHALNRDLDAEYEAIKKALASLNESDPVSPHGPVSPSSPTTPTTPTTPTAPSSPSDPVIGSVAVDWGVPGGDYTVIHDNHGFGHIVSKETSATKLCPTCGVKLEEDQEFCQLHS